MKKNWFYLFALICSVALFTACSDDEDTSWQQIPETEINVGENATLTMNGVAVTTGSVQMTVNDATNGVLTLNNVVPGYDNVQVNVVLEKQADETFRFTGSQELATAPDTKDEASATPIMTVTVEGYISLEGEVSVDVTASGLGLLAGTYVADQLALTYGGIAVTGKSAAFNIVDAQTATITLSGADNALLSGLAGASVKNPGVVPGEASTTLNVTLVPEGTTGYTFAGTDEANGRTLNYTGAIEAGKLTLDVDVTFADNNLQGTWNLFSSDDPWNMTYPIHAVWNHDPQISLGEGFNVDLGWFLNIIIQLPLIGEAGNQQSLNAMIAAVLQNVSFRNDGNLIASYSDAANVAAPSWQNSPEGLVQYAVKNDRILVYLDIDMIMGSLMAASTSTKAEGDVDLVGTLLTTLLGHINEIAPMLSEGISLGYNVDKETGMLSVYVDQNGLGAVLLDIAGELLSNEALMAALSDMMTSNPDFADFAPMVEMLLPQLPAAVAGTTNLELGLNFNPAAAE